MTTQQQPGTEVEKVSPAAIVEKYKGSFARLLPSHMREDGGGDQWVATVKACLVTNPKVAEAAANGPGEFLAALVQAARKGLEPGTKEFHLVPFRPKKGMPPVIQGIEGYQGIVERIYRAGAVRSVIAETVYSADKFQYRPGIDERPLHEVDWFGDRGDLIGAYAYAIMIDGATSKVVVIGQKEAARARAKSASATSEYSPWHTDTAAMWLKTAARRLENWVPTSAEYRRQKLRDAQAVMEERNRTGAIAQQLEDMPIPVAVIEAANQGEDDEVDPEIDPVTGEVLSEDIVDADLVEDRTAEQAPERTVGGEASVPAGAAPTAPAPAAAPKTRPAAGASPAPVDAPLTASQAGAGEETPVPAAAGVSSAAVIAQHQPDPADQPGQDATPAPEVVPHRPGPILARQKTELRAECIRLGIQSVTAEQLMFFDLILELPDGTVTGKDALDRVQAQTIIERLKGFADNAALQAWGAGQTPLLGDDETGEG